MYLGIDIGTSSVKTVLFDRDQRLIGQASQSLSVSRPPGGLSQLVLALPEVSAALVLDVIGIV